MKTQTPPIKRALVTFTALCVAAFALAAFALPAQAQDADEEPNPNVEIGVQSAIVFQALDQENDDNSLEELAPGFQNAVGNLTFAAEVFEGGLVDVDLFISSKHHTETWGYQGYFKMTRLPEWMELGAFSDFYAERLEAKAGQMTLNFGDGHLYQSVNGDVYNNELIGNPVVTPALVTLGAEVTANAGMLHVMGGFSNGTTSGDIQEGKGLALHGKAWITPLYEMARLSFSFYTVDHSGNGTGFPGSGTKSYLFAGGDRGGSRYDVWDGPDGGRIFFGKEQDVTAFQLDGRLDFGPLFPLLVYGNAGWFSENDANGTIDGVDDGNPEHRWAYYMATAKLNVTDWLYLAGRFSTARASKLFSEDTGGTVNRFQVGGGFKLYDGILIKVEYVDQQASNFPAGYVNNGMDLGLEPGFSGFSIETAVSLDTGLQLF